MGCGYPPGAAAGMIWGQNGDFFLYVGFGGVKSKSAPLQAAGLGGVNDVLIVGGVMAPSLSQGLHLARVSFVVRAFGSAFTLDLQLNQ